MPKKDNQIVSRVVEKILQDFDFELDDLLEGEKEQIEQAVKDSILENIDEEPPFVDWIQMAELDEADSKRNEKGDWITN